MEPSETIKNRQAPGIHQPPLSLPGELALWGSSDGTPNHRACPGAQLLHPPAQAPPPHAANVSPLTEASPCRVPACRQGCRRGMQPCSPQSRWREAPAPALAQLSTGPPAPCPGVLCRDTPASLGELWANAGGPQTRAATMSPSPSWPQTHCIKAASLTSSPRELQAPHSSPHA